MSRLKGTLVLVALVAFGGFAGFWIRRQAAPPPLEPDAHTRRTDRLPSAEAAAPQAPATATTALRQPNPKASLLIRLRCAGQPVGGAAFFLTEEATHQREKFTTGPDGAHAVLGLPAGDYHILVDLPDYLPAVAQRAIEADRGHEVVLELQRGTRVEGKVTDPQGHPLEGTTVLLLGENGQPVGQSETDASGEYRIARIPVGVYQASFRHPGYRAGQREPLNVTGTDHVYRIDRVLAGGRAITGKVVTADGTPIPGASVIGNNEEISTCRTDENGAFSLDGLGDGPVSAFASASGYGATFLRNLVPGATNVEFRMNRAGEVNGRISATPSPKQFTVKVSSFEPEYSRFVPLYTRSFGAEPDFHIAEIPPGRYRVEVEAPGFETQDVPELEITAGQSVTGLQVRLRKTP